LRPTLHEVPGAAPVVLGSGQFGAGVCSGTAPELAAPQ